MGNLPRDVFIYNHFCHYASQRSRSKLVSYHVQSRRRRKIVSLREGTLYSPAKSTTTQSREHGAIELYFQKSTRNKGKDRNRKQNLSPCHLTRSPDRDGCREEGEGRWVKYLHDYQKLYVYLNLTAEKTKLNET